MPSLSHYEGMRLLLLIGFIALMNLGNAANLQLNFDQGTFSGTTTGTFTLTGVVPGHGFGSGGYYVGSTYINEYWNFSTQYDTPVGASLANDFDLSLMGHSATGDAVRNGVTTRCSTILALRCGSQKTSASPPCKFLSKTNQTQCLTSTIFPTEILL